ncbi:nitrilase-related carbon-nitrogen hydrolase [Mycobacterium aquaticum]|uniref:Carbon-nitrogen hydrolase n=1 Tax=Mycobacterium aquaticum TaxID=1927124 RepID=A0A1X0AX46_9MYCO|nr:nitrilase-related carbon-nitrogen hydrolase [Mycobacterium aquaticum]ORA34620.1 carbon-nitrogen hydrolase [Mycobacterium aquaticum]
MTVAVAACQVSPVLGDPQANRCIVAAAVGDAANAGAKVVVLPELVSSGYVFSGRAEAARSAEPVDGPTIQLWCSLARTHHLVLVGGFCELGRDDALYNSAVIVDHTGLRAVYRKTHMWDRERLIFTPGDAPPPVVDTEIGRISTMICYDLEFPEWVRIPALAGAQLLAAPVNWPTYPRRDDQRPLEVVRAQADASVNRMAVVACDRTGVERKVGWVGGSVVIDADGWVLAGGNATAEAQTVTAEVDLDLALDKRVGGLSDIHSDRRPELYERVTR